MRVVPRRATAPGSSANLGPGFDALGLALGRYVTVEIRPARRLELRTFGEGAGGDAADHLAVTVACSILGHARFSISVSSDLPVGRGLGSSAALAVAAASAAGAVDPLFLAARLDGHPENAAASVHGGLVVATLVGDQPVVRSLRLDPDLSFVLVVPAQPLLSVRARAVLPEMVPLRDAAFNLGRMGILLAGLADRRQLAASAGEDRLHQRARSALFPEADDVLERLYRAGALLSCWSGAGPSLLAVCDGVRSANEVRSAGAAALRELGVPGEALLVSPDLTGVVVEELEAVGDRSRDE